MIKGISEDILRRVYDFSDMTNEELRCKFFQKLQECIELCNNTSDILDWLKNVGLEKEVNELLKTWKEDGTLENLINIDKLNALKTELLNKLTEDINPVNEKVSNLENNSQNRRNAKFFGVTFDNTDCTEKLQEFFTLCDGLPMYFPSGKIKFSKPILLPKNVDVKCENDTEFLFDENFELQPQYAVSAGLPMFYSVHKIVNGISTRINENFSWDGGIVNGQASEHLDISKPNYWDSADKDGNTAWGHDYQRGFLINGYKNVNIKNIQIKDIFGHGIAHYGNTNFNVDNIVIEQGIDNITHPNGGSRRDGISGSSENIRINNIRAFTDDDYIAIVDNLDWGFGKTHVKYVYINNCEILEKTNHSSIQIIGIYGDGSYKIENMSITNVNGITSKQLSKITNCQISNLTLKDINVKCKNTNTGDNGQISFYGVIDNLTIDNVIFESNCLYPTAFLCNGMRGVATIGRIKNLVVNVQYKMNDTKTHDNVYGKNSFVYNYINSYIDNINGKVIINKNNFGSYYFLNGMGGDVVNNTLTTKLNLEFNGDNTDRTIKQYSANAPKPKVIDGNLYNDKQLALEDGFTFNTNNLTGGNYFKLINGFSKLVMSCYGTFTKDTFVKIGTVNPLNAPTVTKLGFQCAFDKSSTNDGSNGWNYTVKGVGYIDNLGNIFVRASEDNCQYCMLDVIY